jgi:hypothetical protein
MLPMPKIIESSKLIPEQFYADCGQANAIANYLVIVGTMGGRRESRKHKNRWGHSLSGWRKLEKDYNVEN